MLACLNVARRTHTSTSIRPLHPSRSLPPSPHLFTFSIRCLCFFFLSTCKLRFPASSASRIYRRGSCFKNKKLRVLNKTSLWTKVDRGSVWWYQLINIRFSGSTRIVKLKWLLMNVCAELTFFVCRIDRVLMHVKRTQKGFWSLFCAFHNLENCLGVIW